MLSRRLGYVGLDSRRIDESLRSLEPVPFHHSYQDYALGGWESCSLWNKMGDATDGWSREYDGPARRTEYAALVPYLTEISERHFAMEHCKAVRVFRIRNGQLAPHRDYLEFNRGFRRIHLVLRTTPLAFNSEEATVYRMCSGEIWYVDGSPVHSAVNLGDDPRVHLVFDFDPDVREADLLLEVSPEGIAPLMLFDRPPITPEVERSIDGLAVILDQQSHLLPHFIPFLAKLHFFYDVSSRETYAWLIRIAEASQHADAVELARRISEKMIGSVAASLEPA